MNYQKGDIVMLKDTGIIRQRGCNKTCFECLTKGRNNRFIITKLGEEGNTGDNGRCILLGNEKTKGIICWVHPDDICPKRISNWRGRLNDN